ncbi:MAG: MFS transporter [Anaerolineae bacterium]|nr:MFS transporter [Anaerolineae bacterium]
MVSQQTISGGRFYRWYVVGVLNLGLMAALTDRRVLNLLVEPIRRDLGVSDTAISLLLGLSFAIFFSTLGIPIGWLADRYSRRTILTASIATWSLMTAACGLAATYAQLFLARAGVGVGEAGYTPAAMAMIAAYFPGERRSTAISTYLMGAYTGTGLALIIAATVIGLVSARDTWLLPLIGLVRPWQLVLIIVGLPGLLIALLMLAVREPPPEPAAAGAKGRASFGTVLRYVGEHRAAFSAICGGRALFLTAIIGVNAWTPSFFIRTYGWSAQRAGLTLGAIIVVCSTLGILAGGYLADALTRRGSRDANVRVEIGAAVGMAFTCLIFPLMPTAWGAALWLVPAFFCRGASTGVAMAAVQEMLPNAIRAQSTALYLAFVNIVSQGLGPTVVALATDFVFHDPAALRYSLAVITPLLLIAALGCLIAGLRPFRAMKAAALA